MGCSISGCVIFERERSAVELERIEAEIRRLATCGEDRGRDSFGIVAFQKNGQLTSVKNVGRASEKLPQARRFVDASTTIVINNDRAEPTTEYVPVKRADDIQPFGTKVFVTHNGVIANDHELEAKYELTRTTKIDSGILPPLLEKKWDLSLPSLQKILREEILGSFALAVVHSDRPDRVFLACNYKPLFLEYDPALDTLFFTSLESYLQQTGLPLWESKPIRQMTPYSAAEISIKRGFAEASLWKSDLEPPKRKRVLVVCSAGLDSTTAAKVVFDMGHDITLLHFKYRHRAETREAEQVKAIANFFGCEVMMVETDVFKNVIKHSRLTETFEEIEHGRSGEAGAEFAHEWVPARNLIFLSIAVGIAEAYGFDEVVLGNNLEESSAFPDNEMVFINKLNEVLPYATNLQKRVRITMPVGNLMKHEIVKLGKTIGAPLHLTWSCYEGGTLHCGKCGPCFMRSKGFEINGWHDVVDYAPKVEVSQAQKP